MGENLYFLEKNDTFVESKINNLPLPYHLKTRNEQFCYCNHPLGGGE